MINRFPKILLLLAGTIFFAGAACPSNDTTQANKIAQTEIYQSYTVSESGAGYNVKAFFRVGGKTGTTIELTSPAKIAFNGQPMRENKNTFSGTFYDITLPAGTGYGTFTFTDTDGKVYTNKIDLARVGVNLVSPKISAGTTARIGLSKPLPPDTSVEVSAGERSASFTASSGSDGVSLDATKTAIVIDPVFWKNVRGGPVTLDVGFSQSVQVQQGTKLGGVITFDYKAAPAKFALQKGKSIGNTNSVARIGNSKKKISVRNGSVGNLQAVGNK